jgi:hypothetical protein
MKATFFKGNAMLYCTEIIDAGQNKYLGAIIAFSNFFLFISFCLPFAVRNPEINIPPPLGGSARLVQGGLNGSSLSSRLVFSPAWRLGHAAQPTQPLNILTILNWTSHESKWTGEYFFDLFLPVPPS